MRAAGHQLVTPTYTGLGEREHLAAPSIDLELHIQILRRRTRSGFNQIPRSYIYCKRTTPDDTFRPFASRAQREHWGCREIDASHSPHVTQPDLLMATLSDLAAT